VLGGNLSMLPMNRRLHCATTRVGFLAPDLRSQNPGNLRHFEARFYQP
jgi:hypothetical protein